MALSVETKKKNEPCEAAKDQMRSERNRCSPFFMSLLLLKRGKTFPMISDDAKVLSSILEPMQTMRDFFESANLQGQALWIIFARY